MIEKAAPEMSDSQRVSEIQRRLDAHTPGWMRVGSVETWRIFIHYPDGLAGPVLGERVLIDFNKHFPHAGDAEFHACAIEDVRYLLAALAAAEERTARAEVCAADLLQQRDQSEDRNRALAARLREVEAAPAKTPHCDSCICGRRAPVQGERGAGRGPGSIAWSEHLLAWSAYASRYGREQSAERLAERGGFGYLELKDLLGREPTTWEPRG